VSVAVRERVRREASNRCGYCRSRQEYLLGVTGRTACGLATVVALNLNNLIAQMVRARWVEAGWHPPKD
jgi:hypothetical protein